MYQPSSLDLNFGNKILAKLEIKKSLSFEKFGLYSDEFYADAVGAEEFIGWLYVARQGNPVRRSFAELLEIARFRYTEKGLHPPEFLSDCGAKSETCKVRNRTSLI
jgi:hypothetical protein